MMLDFQDYLFLENLAEKVKYHFSEDIDYSKANEIRSVILSKKFNSVYEEDFDECDENLWHAIYKEVDLYIDEETFDEIICEPLKNKITSCCRSL